MGEREGGRATTDSLRTLLAPDEALAAFEVAEVDGAREEVIRALDVTVTAPREGLSPRGGEALRAMGWRWVGTRAERVTLMPGAPCDVWIDPAESTHALVRRRAPRLLPLSSYYLHTYFDDGTCLETVASPRSPMRSDENLAVVHGTDDLAADAAAHLDAVERRALLRNARVMPVRSLRDVARLAAHRYRHVLSREAVTTVGRAMQREVMLLCVTGALTLGLAKAIAALVRALG